MTEKRAHHYVGEKMLLEHKYLQSLRLIARKISHDHNNIYTGLSGQLQLLNRDIQLKIDDEHRRELLTELLERGSKKTSLLQDFARYSSKEKELHSLPQIVETAIEFLSTLSNMHHFSLQKGENLPRIRCSMQEITMAIFYLGENAIEAMPEGGRIRFEISVDTSQPGSISIIVIDSGRGIAPDIRHDLFQPFISSKKSPTQTCGLGLYAAQAIVHDHQGTLALIPGKETAIAINLPYEQQKEPQTTPAPKAHQSQEPTKQVFFIVEDDKALRDFISTGLQRHGHIVFSTGSCTEALKEFELVHEMITVLLIDIGLNDCDGFNCLEKIVSIDRPEQIFFMSGGEITEEMKYGAKFLHKPFTIKQIEERISHAE